MHQPSVVLLISSLAACPLRGQATIDCLFAVIERDVRDAGRVVRRLQLDPRYGFLREYDAETPRIPDPAIHIQVDSLAVIHAGSASTRRPPAP